MRRVGIVIFSVLLSCLPLHAAEYSAVGEVGFNHISAALLTHGFPTKPLGAGRWDLKVVPAYFQMNTEKNKGSQEGAKATGFGLVILGVKSLTNRFGLSFGGNYFSGSGNAYFQETPAGLSPANGGYKLQGSIAYLASIFDPYGGHEKFRLPILVGVAYFKTGDQSTLSRSGLSVDIERTLSTPGITAGISPQIKIGSAFRLAPFFFVALPLSDVKSSCTATGTATCNSKVSATEQATPGPVFGLDFSLVRADFGAAITYSPRADQTVATLSLKWDTSFGEAKATSPIDIPSETPATNPPAEPAESKGSTPSS